MLADAITSQPAQPTQPIPFWANQGNIFLIMALLMVFYFIFSSSKSKRTEQKKRDDMLSGMKRGDRVLTAGGILGSVVEVRDSEVLLKVDESTNTKIKFSRDAIKRIVTDDAPAASAK
jgi:preprotein translocase subunit YajC